MVTKLLEIIIKPEILEKFKSCTKIKKVELSSNDNLLSDGKVNVRFSVTEELNELRKKDLVKSYEIKEFLKKARSFIISIIQKVSEKSPLNSLFFIGSTIFDPKILFESAEQRLISGLNILPGEFMNAKILTSQQCDTVLSQFYGFMENEVNRIEEGLFCLITKKIALMIFVFSMLVFKNYKSFVVKVVLTVNHGQATGKRGFSIKKSSVKTDMTPA